MTTARAARFIIGASRRAVAARRGSAVGQLHMSKTAVTAPLTALAPYDAVPPQAPVACLVMVAAVVAQLTWVWRFGFPTGPVFHSLPAAFSVPVTALLPQVMQRPPDELSPVLLVIWNQFPPGSLVEVPKSNPVIEVPDARLPLFCSTMPYWVLFAKTLFRIFTFEGLWR